MPASRACVPASQLGLHVVLDFEDDRLVRTRFSREPVEGDALSPGAQATADAVARHLETGREDLSHVAVDLSALPPFRRGVLEATRRVPPGSVVTYGELARQLDKPGGARAVGGAMAANPIPLMVPCHRVIASGGVMGNYSGLGGLDTKRALLRLERAPGYRDAVLFRT